MKKLFTIMLALIIASSMMIASVNAGADLPLSGKKAPKGSVLLTKAYPYEIGNVN